ncbi:MULTISPECIES: phospholipase C [unclassified Nostoc]|uniref:phospholipase C n=1 Tax=unclassified Nostoc TaxID=2593658 RepID=UPI002AD4FE3E|nr:alkaline phosphatase family protein [Nostoc sp. DedQUE03]MDZ7975231.1 alkaline phosphatase family protein [Nostoc sp. DedQUE03]MDZ8048846.1 alkaline phosphatase family protein [Nostoc sp. DedQUE02]
MRQFTKVYFALTLLLLPSFIVPAIAEDSLQEVSQANSTITTQPDATPDVARYLNDPGKEPQLPPKLLTRLLQERIKYVFVIFNENHSFDNEYGTLPGVNGLYSDGQKPRDPKKTPGFTQTYTDANGATVTVEPFRIGSEQNASAVDSVDHSHTGLATKLHVVNGKPQMDQFAYDEYTRFASKGGAANIAEGKQFARLVMSHIDCDTIPFFWKWASRFTVFDNIFATEDTPSTPNAVAMLAGQAGETQWVKHGASGKFYTVGSHSGTTQGVPLVNDPQPFYGSQFDTTTDNKQPAGTKESYADGNISSNLTFASLPLTFQGRDIRSVLAGNRNPLFDLTDIQQDIPYIHKLQTEPVNWRWYQEGYDLEPTDTNGIATHNAYVSHHNGAQYFGYIANTPQISKNLRGLNDFFSDIANNSLPKSGVFYIRGGYTNQQGLKPPITNPNTPADEIAAINAAKSGDDDHPGYTDRQLSEGMAARAINAIASNPKIWQQSAIIITYDESDGFYDHVPPRILSYGPDGLPLSRGVRVPLILISPYARTHAVSHVEGDHNSVIETINTIFGLPALASLPDEAQALAAGNSPEFNKFGPPGFQQKYLGPRDINSPITDSLLSGFDPKRLLGVSPPLPASFAKIPDSVVNTLPHYGGEGCRAIGITPEDKRQEIVNNIPKGFNALPSTYPAANP